MRNSDLERDELRTRNLFLIVFYLCATVMISIAFYALYVSAEEYTKTGRIVVGEVLVNTEFPFHGFAKLVTYLMIVSILSWFCVIKLGGNKLKSIPKAVKSILQLIILAIAVVALYEFIYNFILWSSFITDNAIKGVHNSDGINIPYPNPKTPWNLVFATKMTLAAFLIAAHGFYIVSKSEKKEIPI